MKLQTEDRVLINRWSGRRGRFVWFGIVRSASSDYDAGNVTVRYNLELRDERNDRVSDVVLLGDEVHELREFTEGSTRPNKDRVTIEGICRSCGTQCEHRLIHDFQWKHWESLVWQCTECNYVYCDTCSYSEPSDGIIEEVRGELRTLGRAADDDLIEWAKERSLSDWMEANWAEIR